MKKILFLVGSSREGSFNLQVAKEVEALLSGKAEVSYLDYSDVPFFNQSSEYPTPDAVTRVRKTVEEADGVWVFTPEYNQSYPGQVKNVIDWLSRPLKPYDFETPTVIRGKKVALTGAGGNQATRFVREKLVELFTFTGAEVLETQTGIVLGEEAWTKGIVVLTEENKKNLSAQIDAFLKYI